MNELQRQSYLEAMGVDVLVPRFVLPGAKVSERCDIPLPDSVVEMPRSLPTESVGGQAISMPGSSTVDIVSNKEQSSFESIVDEEVSLADIRTPVRVTSEKVPHFQLLFARHTSGLVFVIHSKEGRLSQDQHSLLNEIVFALGFSALLHGQQLEWSYEIFRWPLLKTKQLEQGEDAARQTLNGFIKRVDAKELIILGRLSAHYIYPKSKEADSAAFVDYRYFPYSLDDLFSQPLLKRQLWQQLNHIRKKHH